MAASSSDASVQQARLNSSKYCKKNPNPKQTLQKSSESSEVQEASSRGEGGRNITTKGRLSKSRHQQKRRVAIVGVGSSIFCF